MCFNEEDRDGSVEKFRAAFMPEYELLSALPLHRNVVRLYGQFSDK